MLKNILKLDGALQLSKNEQKLIQGARRQPLSLCAAPVEYCAASDRNYDPCRPITQTNYPC